MRCCADLVIGIGTFGFRDLDTTPCCYWTLNERCESAREQSIATSPTQESEQLAKLHELQKIGKLVFGSSVTSCVHAGHIDFYSF